MGIRTDSAASAIDAAYHGLISSLRVERFHRIKPIGAHNVA